jgi:mannose-1-phosphate guanylyltransferase
LQYERRGEFDSVELILMATARREVDKVKVTRDVQLPATAKRGDLWVILLAAGDGSRIHGLVSDMHGVSAPKQFCTLDRTESMLRWSVRRALGMVPRNRVVSVVADQHRHWWTEELADLPPENVVIQPRNRGTAAGILLPLLRVLRQDRHAVVLILPSDHYVRDERRLRASMRRAIDCIECGACRIGLLGIVPQEVDSGYGWIVPASTAETAKVEAFVEKPDADEARSLMRSGALLNSFIIAAKAEALLQLYLYTIPELVGAFLGWKVEGNGSWSDLVGLYDRLPTCDFSREVLQRASDHLFAVRVSECGWSDLGTPARLHDYQECHSPVPAVRQQQWTV